MPENILFLQQGGDILTVISKIQVSLIQYFTGKVFQMENTAGAKEPVFGANLLTLSLWNKEITREGHLLPIAVAFQTTESSQPNFTEPTDPIDDIFLRVLIILAFISSSLLWLRRERNPKKQRAKHVADILQEVENLEKIRKITPDTARLI